mgnify:CR=1 FL=1
MSRPIIDLHMYIDYILALVDLSFIACPPNGMVDTDSGFTTYSGGKGNHYLYQGSKIVEREYYVHNLVLPRYILAYN